MWLITDCAIKRSTKEHLTVRGRKTVAEENKVVQSLFTTPWKSAALKPNSFVVKLFPGIFVRKANDASEFVLMLPFVARGSLAEFSSTHDLLRTILFCLLMRRGICNRRLFSFCLTGAEIEPAGLDYAYYREVFKRAREAFYYMIDSQKKCKL